MGSRPDTTVSLYEAANLMDVHPKYVTRKLKELGLKACNLDEFGKGKTHPRYANSLRFRRGDINTYIRHRDRIEKIRGLEEQNQELTALAKSLEQRLDVLEYTIGLRMERLSLDDREVKRRFDKCKYLLEQRFFMTTTAILDWSRFFFAVTEAYFVYMATRLKEEDPWVHFIKLADLLTVSLSPEYAASLEGSVAQECLELGRKNLRSVAYWCSVNKYGLQGAVEQVPQAHEGDVDEEIIAYILSRNELKDRIRVKKTQYKLSVSPAKQRENAG